MYKYIYRFDPNKFKRVPGMLHNKDAGPTWMRPTNKGIHLHKSKKCGRLNGELRTNYCTLR
jgi:hypothetical protein